MSAASLQLDRREVVARLLADRAELLVVAGLGSATYDCAAAGDDPRNFYLWGAMGGTAPLALGPRAGSAADRTEIRRARR